MYICEYVYIINIINTKYTNIYYISLIQSPTIYTVYIIHKLYVQILSTSLQHFIIIFY